MIHLDSLGLPFMVHLRALGYCDSKCGKESSLGTEITILWCTRWIGKFWVLCNDNTQCKQ